MLSVQLRFYEELNDFIRKEYRKKQINRHLKHRTTVKDVIESFGVPHTEVTISVKILSFKLSNLCGILNCFFEYLKIKVLSFTSI